jgi:hypothetical protein
MTMEGFFDLQTPEHLLRKLEREHERWKADPLNADMAWNFFVTAEHLPDWLARTGPKLLGGFSIENFRRNQPLMRVCSHLASGGKHFRANPKRHMSVKGTGREDDFVEEDFVEDDFIEDPELLVYLTPDERHALKQGDDSVRALWLAGEVLAFWQRYFRERFAP